MNFFYKIDELLAGLEKILIVFFFTVLLLLTVFNIISRNLFHVSYAWILEYSPAFVVWLCMMGATLAFRRQGHIKLELLLRYCPERFRNSAHIATGVFGMIIMGVLLVVAVEFVKNEVEFFGIRGWLAVILPLFFLFALFRYFMQVMTSIKTLIHPPVIETCNETMGEGADR